MGAEVSFYVLTGASPGFRRLVAIDSRARRDGRPIEVRVSISICSTHFYQPVTHWKSSKEGQNLSRFWLGACRAKSLIFCPFFVCPQRLGYYDPLRKETNLNAPAIKKWLAVGAQTSQTVGNLLKKAMVVE